MRMSISVHEHMVNVVLLQTFLEFIIALPTADIELCRKIIFDDLLLYALQTVCEFTFTTEMILNLLKSFAFGFWIREEFC